MSPAQRPLAGGAPSFEQVNELATSDAAKALVHPLRAQILEKLAGREASPLDLAVELNESSAT